MGCFTSMIQVVTPVIRTPKAAAGATDAHVIDIALNTAGNDPRYRPRRSRHARSRYHSRRHVTSLDALSRQYRWVLHDLLRRPCRRRGGAPSQPPICAHIVPFFSQKKLRCAVPQDEKGQQF